MPDASPEHDLEFFRNGGFRRQQCASCKSWFWGLTEARVCGEAPCDEYGFIDSRSFSKSLTRDEMRELYLSFFEKRDHTRVQRYPIVARWRKDTFFTNASIYAFQPWVVKGVVEPPANPLVMSQTSVRFNDMDNVGRTGRHLTMFEMMAHHAFNKRGGREIYWKEKCTELCHELLVKELGAKAEEVKYKEEAWQGGGNSGPSLSVGIKGLEVATLVFMQYEDVPAPQGSPPGTKPGKKEMDIYIVDTGYGLERFTWMSQATPNAYEAVFPEVLAKMREKTGLRVDERVMRQFAKVAGLMDLETTADLRILREKVAKHVGMDPVELTKMVEPIENLYAIVDHTRALAFLLNDGVVPSNAKAGYFARLLVRRALRSAESIGLKLPLAEIVAWHIASLSSSFPDLAEHQADILGLVEIEEKRYRATVERGGEMVRKIEKEKGRIDLEQLISLYDSHGLTPDTVKRLAKSEVAVPDDFFQQVAARHENEEGEAEALIPHSPAATESLCYTKKEELPWDFRTNVIDALPGEKGAVWLVFDRTYFYPEGGGQEADQGHIRAIHNKTEMFWDVVDVQKSGRCVLHRIEGVGADWWLKQPWKIAPDGSAGHGFPVDCYIEKERRYNLMRHHTATHVLNGVAKQVLGNHVWQAGAHKSESGARLDLTHYDSLDDATLRKMEWMANDIVMQDLPISKPVLERTEAERKFGFTIYQGGFIPGKDLRIVDITGHDVEACGGTHCDRTGEIGLIKITGSKRIQDGIVRVEFVAGRKALELVANERMALRKVSELLHSPPDKVPESVATLVETRKKLEKELAQVAKESAGELISHLLRGAKEVGELKLLVSIGEYESDIVEQLSRQGAEMDGVLLVLNPKGTNQLLVARGRGVDVDCREVFKRIAVAAGGGGGGRPDFARGAVKEPGRVPEAAATALAN